MAKVLILGSGAREHALAWKMAQSKQAEKVYLHPGNAGTLRSGFESFGGVQTLPEIVTSARAKKIDLIVIGPEIYLAEGYAETLRKEGFSVFGPDSSSARLETSKVFAKEFMVRAKIPTARFTVLKDVKSLQVFRPETFPYVLKLDGLAAGKGVVIAKTQSDITEFADRIWEKKEFGDGLHRVLAEEFIPGKELSYIGLCDGKTFYALSSATDYKRVFDGDEGPNTGGMGAISPSPYFSSALEAKIEERIIQPILKQLSKEGLDYRGALYVGIMIDSHGDPFVLEFNARFGDPETQALMLRFDADLFTYLSKTAMADLASLPRPAWKNDTSVYVVAASEGYPGKIRTGDAIEGLKNIDSPLFYSGVSEKNGALTTSGGRVLGVGALGNNSQSARERAYSELKKISWTGIHYRKDIGRNI